MLDTTSIDIGEPLPLEYNTVRVTKPNKAVSKEDGFVNRLKQQMLQQLKSQTGQQQKQKADIHDRIIEPLKVDLEGKHPVQTPKVKMRKVSGSSKVIGQPLPLNYSAKTVNRRKGARSYHDLGYPLPLKYTNPENDLPKVKLTNGIQADKKPNNIEPVSKAGPVAHYDDKEKQVAGVTKRKVRVPDGYATGYTIALIISILCYISYLLAD